MVQDIIVTSLLNTAYCKGFFRNSKGKCSPFEVGALCLTTHHTSKNVSVSSSFHCSISLCTACGDSVFCCSGTASSDPCQFFLAWGDQGPLEAFFAELGQAASQSVSCSESFPTHFAQAFPKPPQDSPSLPEAIPSTSEASPSLPEAFPQAELRPGVRACVCVWVCACVRVCVCVCVCVLPSVGLSGPLWASASQPA